MYKHIRQQIHIFGAFSKWTFINLNLRHERIQKISIWFSNILNWNNKWWNSTCSIYKERRPKNNINWRADWIINYQYINLGRIIYIIIWFKISCNYSKWFTKFMQCFWYFHKIKTIINPLISNYGFQSIIWTFDVSQLQFNLDIKLPICFNNWLHRE